MKLYLPALTMYKRQDKANDTVNRRGYGYSLFDLSVLFRYCSSADGGTEQSLSQEMDGAPFFPNWYTLSASYYAISVVLNALHL